MSNKQHCLGSMRRPLDKHVVTMQMESLKRGIRPLPSKQPSKDDDQGRASS